jgi:hypothetical protein
MNKVDVCIISLSAHAFEWSFVFLRLAIKESLDVSLQEGRGGIYRNF